MPIARIRSVRWFRFGLRMLFSVVTLVAVLCAWQANTVRQRQAARVWVHAAGGRVEADGQTTHVPGEQYHVWLDQKPLGERKRRIPLWRQWMGDEPIERVVLPQGATVDEIAEVKALFPETRYIVTIATPASVVLGIHLKNQ